MDDHTAAIYIEEESLRAGYTTIPNLILGRDDLSPGAKLVYLGLLHFAWQDPACFPGQARMGMFLGMHEATIRRYLRELEMIGLVITKRRGLNQTNIYHLPDHARVLAERANRSLRKVRSSAS